VAAVAPAPDLRALGLARAGPRATRPSLSRRPRPRPPAAFAERNRGRRRPARCAGAHPHRLGDLAMDHDRRSILQMLSEQKISPDQAERLLAALERPGAAAFAPASGHNGAPK